MLATYLTRTKNLLQSPGAPTQLYSNANLTDWINISRGQLAGEGECIRVLGTINTVVGQRNYNFSGINLGVVATTGVQGAIHVRTIFYSVASGMRKINAKPWTWFEMYGLNNPVPQNGPPQMWAQFGQGSSGTSTGTAATGSFYLDPPPDIVYTLTLDCVCYPAALADDTTIEAIPYLWTDAVPFFAAYYAYLSSQTGARQADAERMFSHYQAFVERARTAANPSTNRWMYSQAPDPVQVNKIAMQKPAQGGG